MLRALELARTAFDEGEVPVGAVLTLDGAIIGEGFNQPIATRDATAHAEVIALREAGRRQDNYRLPGSTLYVTVEPCMMCAGAIVHARVEKLVFGAAEPKAGAVSHGLLANSWLNHRVAVESGVCADECGDLMTKFFEERRQQ